MPSQAQSCRPAVTGAKGVSDRSGEGELLLLEPKVVFQTDVGRWSCRYWGKLGLSDRDGIGAVEPMIKDV